MILILFIILIPLFIVLSFVWPPDSPWAPQWRIKRKKALEAIAFIGIQKKDVVYELGCGDGEFILTASETVGCKTVGIEIDPTRFLVSYIRARISKASEKITVIRKDFKKVDLSAATVIYMYLIPEGMKKLVPKFTEELRAGTKILSYRYKIPLSENEKIQLSKTNGEFYLYEVV